MANVNLFEWATKNKVRFESTRGLLTVEDLWTLPLTSKNGVSLKTVYASLKDVVGVDDDFLKEMSEKDIDAERKMSIIKHIAEQRQEEAKASEERAKKRERNALIRDMIHEREIDSLREKTPEELRKMLDE